MRGRPRRRIDAELLQEILGRNYTLAGAAQLLGVGRATLYRHMREALEIADAVDRGRAIGRIRVKRELWRIAMQDTDLRGAATALIFLAKAHLGMSDGRRQRLPRFR